MEFGQIVIFVGRGLLGADGSPRGDNGVIGTAEHPQGTFGYWVSSYATAVHICFTRILACVACPIICLRNETENFVFETPKCGQLHQRSHSVGPHVILSGLTRPYATQQL